MWRLTLSLWRLVQPQMSPLDLALAALFAVSFVLSVFVLAIIALILEAVMFALGRKAPD
jgi:hypothetical protein